ncbi:MAG: hypothetical protein UV73_C0002G0016 [Candidatus Gottesmanbacteria bacterium GW2011_GWA2_43_14]|uniref:Dockerin domain-containing protein n=1 Tax=Candidatus Gottesmanbacteria bacterium GW2011_GWA2_43_14 TaxID=1618443 RepID=A0A0G1DL53_9BACT|nr:MAG: hypothetical protein UV73_C0002G0016 [Candidatus Gottesmanbacteria bacterium GW2011_GWA2_43_14]
MFRKIFAYILLSLIILLTDFYFLNKPVPEVQAQTCLTELAGDANRDCKVDGIDYVIWLKNYNKTVSDGRLSGDFNNNGKVDGLDYVIWLNNYNKNSSPFPTVTGTQPTQPATGELDISICDPTNGPFSLNITNPYFPLPVGKVNTISDGTFTVKFSVLNQTEVVAGITTRVVEEYETNNGNLIEISRNFFVAAPDGTVCYYGEDVDIYSGGQIVGHSGAWRAGEGSNKPGIVMPANPTVGQTYQQEVAPGIAMDRAAHIRFEQNYNTPAGIFNNVLYVEETPPSTKRYAPGVGMIYDDGALLISYNN